MDKKIQKQILKLCNKSKMKIDCVTVCSIPKNMAKVCSSQKQSKDAYTFLNRLVLTTSLTYMFQIPHFRL